MNKVISITKYTVFGSTGFLGSNFKKYLKKKKYQIFCPLKKDYKFKKNLGHVFYCAGTSDSITNPNKALKANLVYLNNILLNNNFESFTYFSSIRVYSSSKSTNENSKILCDVSEKGIYFKNLKLAAESLCRSPPHRAGAAVLDHPSEDLPPHHSAALPWCKNSRRPHVGSLTRVCANEHPSRRQNITKSPLIQV